MTGFADGGRAKERVYDLLGIREEEQSEFMKKRGAEGTEKRSDWIMQKKKLRQRFKKLPADADEQTLEW